MKWIGIGVTALVVAGIGFAVAMGVRSDSALYSGTGTSPKPTVTGAPAYPTPTPSPAPSPPAPPIRPPQPAPIAPADPFRDVDRALEEMERASVAFNAPRSLDLGERANIQLLLSLRKSLRALQRELVESGQREGSRVPVTPLVEARLTGLGFTIEALTEQQQPIGRRTDAEWRWEIEGKQAGAQRLHLTLTALVPVKHAGGRVTRTIDTFDRTIAIQVGWKDRTSEFLAANWQWLWAAIVVPVAGVVLQYRRRRSGSSARATSVDSQSASETLAR
jgi:hypothetical protein